jgi:hypothetical protein
VLTVFDIENLTDNLENLLPILYDFVIIGFLDAENLRKDTRFMLL